MAWEVKQHEGEDEAKAQQYEAAPVAPAPAGASSVAQTPTSAPAPNPQAAPTSKFVNFDRVMNANKDVATKSTQQLIGTVSAPANQAQAELDSRRQTFNAGVQQGTAAMPQAWNGGSTRAGRIPGTVTSQVGLNAPQGEKPWWLSPEAAATAVNPNARTWAGLKYTGPNALSEGEGWNNFYNNAQSAANRATALGRPGGVEAELKKGTAGQYSAGESSQDAALLGSIGGKDIRDTATKFKKFSEILGGADAESRNQAAAAKKGVDDFAADWKGRVDRLDKEEAENKRANTAAAEAAAQPAIQYAKDREGKPTWEEFSKVRAEGVVRDIHEATDPFAWLARITGERSPQEFINSKLDPQFGLNSGQIRIKEHLPGMPEQNLKKVYESLTKGELEDLQRMVPGSQRKWLQDRALSLEKHGWTGKYD